MTRTILSVAAILSMSSCASHKAVESSDAKSNMASVAVSDSTANRPRMLGAYSERHEPSQADLDLFTATYSGDIALSPKSVAVQVVAGTNYSFFCQDNNNDTYEVIIFRPLPGNGEPSVSSVTKQ